VDMQKTLHERTRVRHQVKLCEIWLEQSFADGRDLYHIQIKRSVRESNATKKTTTVFYMKVQLARDRFLSVFNDALSTA